MDNKFKTIRKIDISQAVKFTQNWVKFASSNPGFKRSFLIEKEDIDKLTALKDFKGIRIYFGKETDTEEGNLRLVLTAVDEWEQDILTDETDVQNAPVFDFSMPCPDTCGDIKSPLYKGFKEN